MIDDEDDDVGSWSDDDAIASDSELPTTRLHGSRMDQMNAQMMNDLVGAHEAATPPASPLRPRNLGYDSDSGSDSGSESDFDMSSILTDSTQDYGELPPELAAAVARIRASDAAQETAARQEADAGPKWYRDIRATFAEAAAAAAVVAGDEAHKRWKKIKGTWNLTRKRQAREAREQVQMLKAGKETRESRLLPEWKDLNPKQKDTLLKRSSARVWRSGPKEMIMALRKARLVSGSNEEMPPEWWKEAAKNLTRKVSEHRKNPKFKTTRKWLPGTAGGVEGEFFVEAPPPGYDPAEAADRLRDATRGFRVAEEISGGRIRKTRVRKGRGKTQKGRARKSRARKSRARKSRARKSRVRKSRVRKGRVRKGVARKGRGETRRLTPLQREWKRRNALLPALAPLKN